MIRQHYNQHIEGYKKESQQNPEYQGLKELHDLVKKVGLHEELGIDKSTQEQQSKDSVIQSARKNSTVDMTEHKISAPSTPTPNNSKTGGIGGRE